MNTGRLSARSIPLISEWTSTGRGPEEVLGACQQACFLLRLILDKSVNESIGQSGRCLRPEIPGLEFKVCQEATGGVQSYPLLPSALRKPVLALLPGVALEWCLEWVGGRHHFCGLRNHSGFGVSLFSLYHRHSILDPLDT